MSGIVWKLRPTQVVNGPPRTHPTDAGYLKMAAVWYRKLPAEQ